MDNTHYTIKPAAGLLILSITIGLASWLLNLCTLLVVSLPTFLLLFWILFSKRGSRLHWWLLPIIIGVLVSSLYAGRFISTRFDESLQGKDLDIEGYIASLPVANSMVTRFDFDVDSPEVGQNESGLYPKKVRLNWYEAPELKVGEYWRMTVRLRQPHGFASAGAFEIQATI